jgi:hypothetical protein
MSSQVLERFASLKSFVAVTVTEPDHPGWLLPVRRRTAGDKHSRFHRRLLFWDWHRERESSGLSDRARLRLSVNFHERPKRDHRATCTVWHCLLFSTVVALMLLTLRLGAAREAIAGNAKLRSFACQRSYAF